MRFVAGRGRRGGGAVGRGAMAELLLVGALQRSAIGKRFWQERNLVQEWHWPDGVHTPSHRVAARGY